MYRYFEVSYEASGFSSDSKVSLRWICIPRVRCSFFRATRWHAYLFFVSLSKIFRRYTLPETAWKTFGKGWGYWKTYNHYLIWHLRRKMFSQQKEENVSMSTRIARIKSNINVSIYIIYSKSKKWWGRKHRYTRKYLV
jgi:hypothetical protein